MKTEIYAKKAFDGEKIFQDNPVLSAYVEGKDAFIIAVDLMKVPGVEEVRDISGGWAIKGRCNPPDLFQIVCSHGYPILGSKIKTGVENEL